MPEQRFNWRPVGFIPKPGDKIQLGFRTGIYDKFVRNVKNGTRMYTADTGVKNKTRFIDYSEKLKMFFDESLNVYTVAPLGDETEPMGWILTKVRCKTCKSGVTYAEGMIFCHKCNAVKDQFV